MAGIREELATEDTESTEKIGDCPGVGQLWGVVFQTLDTLAKRGARFLLVFVVSFVESFVETVGKSSGVAVYVRQIRGAGNYVDRLNSSRSHLA